MNFMTCIRLWDRPNILSKRTGPSSSLETAYSKHERHGLHTMECLREPPSLCRLLRLAQNVIFIQKRCYTWHISPLRVAYGLSQ